MSEAGLLMPETKQFLSDETRHALVEISTIIICTILIILSIFNYIVLWMIMFAFIIVISARYQLLAKIHNFHPMMMEMTLQDKFINEHQYQIKKRGYKVKYFYIGGGEHLDFKTDASTFTKKWCKTVTFINMMLNPGWSFRDLEDEEFPEAVENEDEARETQL